MGIKFSEDIVPLSDLKVNPGKVVARANETHRPILLTSRGRGVAVVQSLKDYEEETEERVFMQEGEGADGPGRRPRNLPERGKKKPRSKVVPWQKRFRFRLPLPR